MPKCRSNRKVQKCLDRTVLWKDRIPNTFKSLGSSGGYYGVWDSRPGPAPSKPDSSLQSLPQVTEVVWSPVEVSDAQSPMNRAERRRPTKSTAPSKNPVDAGGLSPPSRRVVLPSALDLISRVDAHACGFAAPLVMVKGKDYELGCSSAGICARSPDSQKEVALPPLSSILSEGYRGEPPFVAISPNLVNANGQRRSAGRYEPYKSARLSTLVHRGLPRRGTITPPPAPSDDPPGFSVQPQPNVNTHSLSPLRPGLRIGAPYKSRVSTAPSTPPQYPPSLVALQPHSKTPQATKVPLSNAHVAPSLSNVTQRLSMHPKNTSAAQQLYWIPFFANWTRSVSPYVAFDRAPHSGGNLACPSPGVVWAHSNDLISPEQKDTCSSVERAQPRSVEEQDLADKLLTLNLRSTSRSGVRQPSLPASQATLEDPGKVDTSCSEMSMVVVDPPGPDVDSLPRTPRE
ncbi:hypothetical protein BD414DRAFT_489039 [Trametes punicea]|nr:hypothetical protein BD414DRAFT_489039 [Trametes punicea]